MHKEILRQCHVKGITCLRRRQHVEWDWREPAFRLMTTDYDVRVVRSLGRLLKLLAGALPSRLTTVVISVRWNWKNVAVGWSLSNFGNLRELPARARQQKKHVRESRVSLQPPDPAGCTSLWILWRIWLWAKVTFEVTEGHWKWCHYHIIYIYLFVDTDKISNI